MAVIHTSRARMLGRELALVGGLFVLYKALRLVTSDAGQTAITNAWQVLHVERALGLPSELGLQQLMLSSEAVTRLANLYYAGVHFPLTIAFLVWAYARHRDMYVPVRNVLVGLTMVALVIHAAFPLAPARMLDSAGFVDTGALLGPSVYGPPTGDSVSNQFAAMPSLHFGWAVVVAWGIVSVGRSPLVWLWVLHPVATLAVIVGTGNHYWLDAVVAGVLVVSLVRIQSGAAILLAGGWIMPFRPAWGGCVPPPPASSLCLPVTPRTVEPRCRAPAP